MAKQLPLVSTVKSTFRVPRDLYQQLKIRAVQEDRTVAELLEDAIALYLSQGKGIASGRGRDD